jgi:hypothetical protein
MSDISMPAAECSTCSVKFSLEMEGGIQGNFGIIPVAFCPTCLCSAIDMVHQLEGYEDDELQ